MSVPRISKRVTDRQKRYEFVDGLVREQRADVIDALTLLFQGDGTSPKPDVSAYLDGLLGVMKHSFDDLVRAERIHLNELSGDGGSRRRRDNAVSGLREVLLDMRSLLRGAFGVERTEALGFERRIAPHPQPLLRQALRIEGQLRAREIEVPEPRFRGVSIRLELLADELRPHEFPPAETAPGRRQGSPAAGRGLRPPRQVRCLSRLFSCSIEASRSSPRGFHLFVGPRLRIVVRGVVARATGVRTVVRG